jgi:hypothetical protein
VWDLKISNDEEIVILKYKNNIYINNYNTNPKLIKIGRGRIGMINNNDKIIVLMFTNYQLMDEGAVYLLILYLYIYINSINMECLFMLI